MTDPKLSLVSILQFKLIIAMKFELNYTKYDAHYQIVVLADAEVWLNMA